VATKLLSPLLSILLTPLLTVEPVMAQSPAAPDLTGESLQIKLADTHAVAGQQERHGLTVEVTDATGAHVSDAAVIFRLPDNGSSARFADGTLAVVTYTDAEGKAHASDIRSTDTSGSVIIRVTAVKGTAHAGLLFEQTLGPATIPVPVPVTRQSVPVQPATPVPAPVEMPRPKEAPVSAIPQRVSASRPPLPGSLPAVSVTKDDETDDSLDTNVPVRHLTAPDKALDETQEVTISSSGAASSGGHSKTKWITILAIAAGTGAALAFVHKGNSSSSSSSSSGVSIGSPSISVGHP
jgi:hypothetical protein